MTRVRSQRTGALVLLVLLMMGCSESPMPRKTAGLSGDPVVVRLANMPYADCSYSVIGAEKGFFADVGIVVQHEQVRIEDVVSALANGRFDVVSAPPGLFFAAHDTAPELRSFVFADLFQGFALMANPDAGHRSYSYFRQTGMSHKDAVSGVVQQLRGRTFAYPTEAAIKPFIDFLLASGGVDRSELRSLVLDDALTVASMRRGDADFQVGGAPSRITLQKEGFVPLIAAVDLAKGASPTRRSRELATVGLNGWATTERYYEEHHDTILRLASVNYRIIDFMREHRAEALRIHMRYLSRVTGQEFDASDGAVIYDDLDPFFSFEEQREWYFNEENPLYYAHIKGAILDSFVDDGVFKKEPPTVEDVIFSDDVYRELVVLRDAAKQRIESLKQGTLDSSSAETLKQAEQHYEWRNYYDADRLSRLVASGRT